MKDKDNETLQLSIVDIEKKYQEFEYDEISTGSDRPVMWGVDNRLAKLYYNCYAKSSTLKACIDSAVNYILGESVNITEQAAAWKEKVNRTGMNMNEFIRKISFSILLYNGFAIQVIYNKLGQVVEIYPLDFSRCRLSEDEKKVFYSKKWTKYNSKYETYDRFNPLRIDSNNPTQIFYYKSGTLSNIYPLPPYNGALYDILTEIECSKYALNTVAGGFSAKYIIQFPQTANLTNEQKKNIKEGIKSHFTGSETESNFMIYWKDEDGKAIEVNKIEGDETPERYIAIKDSARQNIFVSMRTSPVLCGLQNQSNGFSTQEYSDSFKIYQKNVIDPIQDLILDTIIRITGVPKDSISIAPYTITFDEQK